MPYTLLFLLACALSLIFTPLAKRLAIKAKILDIPNSPRKIHSQPIPFLGGVAIFFAFAISLLLYLKFGQVNFNVIPVKFFSAILAGGGVLVIGGSLDEKFNLPPKILWLFPALASLIFFSSAIFLV